MCVRRAGIKLRAVPGTEQPGEFTNEYLVVDGGLVAVNPRCLCPFLPSDLHAYCTSPYLLTVHHLLTCRIPRTPVTRGGSTPVSYTRFMSRLRVALPFLKSHGLLFKLKRLRPSGVVLALAILNCWVYDQPMVFFN